MIWDTVIKNLENIEPLTILEDKIRTFYENGLKLMLDKKQYNIIYIDEVNYHQNILMSRDEKNKGSKPYTP